MIFEEVILFEIRQTDSFKMILNIFIDACLWRKAEVFRSTSTAKKTETAYTKIGLTSGDT